MRGTLQLRVRFWRRAALSGTSRQVRLLPRGRRSFLRNIQRLHHINDHQDEGRKYMASPLSTAQAKSSLFTQMNPFCSHLLSFRSVLKFIINSMICRLLTLALVWGIILSLAFSYSLLHILPLLLRSPSVLALVVPFLLLLLMVLVTYAFAITTSPGHADQPPLDQFEEAELNKVTEDNKKFRQACKDARRAVPESEEVRMAMQVTFCGKCKVVKPVRAHHCSTCGRCVLRMDHHCPWIGQCVGHRNHKHFMLFLLYTTIELALVWGSMLIDFVGDGAVFDRLSYSFRIVWWATVVAAFLLDVSIGFLLFSQLVQFRHNNTTLESFSNAMTKQRPFDRGSFTLNFQEVMGPNQWLWLVPVDPPDMLDFSETVNE